MECGHCIYCSTEYPYKLGTTGDGTLDGAAFRFWREETGNLYVDFYKGKVEPLGVTALTQQAAIELDSSVESVRQNLTDANNPKLHQQLWTSKVRRSVQKLVANVVMKGNEKHQELRRIFVNDDIGKNTRVFIGGGGGTATFFQEAILKTHSDFKQGNAGIPPYQIKEIPPPKDLAINGIDPKEFGRFAVAYGLCIPAWEGPKIRLPSQVQKNISATYKTVAEPAPFDETKDMM